MDSSETITMFKYRYSDYDKDDNCGVRITCEVSDFLSNGEAIHERESVFIHKWHITSAKKGLKEFLQKKVNQIKKDFIQHGIHAMGFVELTHHLIQKRHKEFYNQYIKPKNLEGGE